MKILVTGAGGFLGGGLIEPFVGRHDLRLMDVVDWQTPHEKVLGDVADLETCRRAVQGCQGIVIAHMASRQAGAFRARAISRPSGADVKSSPSIQIARNTAMANCVTIGSFRMGWRCQGHMIIPLRCAGPACFAGG